MRCFLFLAFLLPLFLLPAHGETVAELHGIPHEELLFDGDFETAQICGANSSLLLQQPDGIGALYLIFDREYGAVTLTTPEGEECFFQTDGILHCFIDLAACFGKVPEALSLCFSDGAAYVNELCLFPPGAVPDWVQRWERIPYGKADLLLFSSHGDDEQLFFAGLLPWYGGEKGLRIQVVYFTDHRNMVSGRVHEMLNGLWAVGIRDYPVLGSFADYYTFDLEDAYRFYADAGHSEEKLVSFVVEQLRRYRPLVAVGHDPRGEYGHGMHQLCSELLQKAVGISADPEAFPELARRYGVWDVPKTYLHLYPENRITLNWDIPMESFDGRTAYEVSRDLGFASHVSQQRDFAWYFRGADRAAQIGKYSPCHYGLYRTTVGEDVQKNDFFENIGNAISPFPSEAAENPVPTVPPETVPPPAVQPAQPQLPAAETNWLLLPAIGTFVLVILTASLTVPATGEKDDRK